MTMLNTCKCGGEVHLDYQQSDYTGQYWYAICNDCGIEYPLKADNRLDAVREWNECKGVGEMQMTNEEWFCQLPTYKKAIIMANCYDALNLDQYACNKHIVIEKWLKNIHE